MNKPRIEILKGIYRGRGAWGTVAVFTIGPVLALMFGIGWVLYQIGDWLMDTSHFG